jgi:hypothetical protein
MTVSERRLTGAQLLHRWCCWRFLASALAWELDSELFGECGAAELSDLRCATCVSESIRRTLLRFLLDPNGRLYAYTLD